MKRLFPILIIATLTLVSCGTNKGELAGRVNGTPIQSDQFYDSLRGHFSNFSYKYGRNPDSKEKDRIVTETWENITKFIILKDYYDKFKISASPKEVIDTLSSSIPEHILASPRFKVNGSFDKSLYMQALLTDRPENLAPLRKHYKDNVIPIMKLKDKLIEKEMITKKHYSQISKILASEADINLYIFDPESYQISISDAEIVSYYQANLEKYRLEPYHRLAYALIPVEPDEDDYLLSKAVADSIYELLNAGTDAKDIIHAKQGGSSVISMVESDYAKTTELPLDIQNVLNDLSSGQCSQPLRDDKGWVIRQKLQGTKTLTLYRSIFIQSLPRTAALIKPESTARNLMNLALRIGLKDAADEFDINYLLGQAVNPDSLDISASDIRPMVLRKLANAPAGSIFEPIFSSELVAWVLIEVLENQTKDYQIIDEVQQSIRNELITTRKQDISMLSARQWISSQAANAASIPPDEELRAITAQSEWRGASFTNLYYQALTAYLDKTNPPAIMHQGVVVVPIVKAIKYNDRKATDEQIRAVYAQTLSPNWFNVWLNEKAKAAKVDIYLNQ